MTLLESIQLSAMRSVVHGDVDYRLRQVLRWYSKEFYTPLSEVENIPLDEVLQAYFECLYEDMEETEREREIKVLLETEEERKKKKFDQDRINAEDEEFAKLVEMDIQKPKPAKKLIQKIDQISENIKDIVESIPKTKPKKIEQTEIEQKMIKNPPPDIKMNFLEEDLEFQDMLEGVFGPKPKVS